MHQQSLRGSFTIPFEHSLFIFRDPLCSPKIVSNDDNSSCACEVIDSMSLAIKGSF